MKKLALALLPFVFVLLGCQSYQDGLSALCNAPSTCGEPCASVAPEMRMMRMAEHIDDVVSNGEATALFESLAMMAPADRAVLLKQEAAKTGLPGCPLADIFAAFE